MPYMMGLLEGFQQRRDKEFERNFAIDQDRRKQEGQIYKMLLESRDPQMQALALTGLMDSAQPGKRSKGLQGYLGEVQGSPHFSKVLEWANGMVPIEGTEGQPATGGPAPPQPGSGAMPTNVPVQPGSSPINLGGAVPGGGSPDFDANAPWNPAMGGGGGAPSQVGPGDPAGGPGDPGGLAPPPIPGYSPLLPKKVESRFKRRGTGIPTAEEIAEWQAEGQVRGRFGATGEMLRGVGASEDEVQEAFLGMAGRPKSARQFERATGMAMKTPDGRLVPLSFDNTSGQYFLPDGKTPFPEGGEMVQMGGRTSSGGALKRDVVQDPQSPTGRSAVYTNPATGEEVYRQVGVAFTPPPAYSGTLTDFDEAGVPVRRPVLRGGGLGPPIADVPEMRDSQEASQAKALLSTVDRAVQARMRSRLGGALGVSDAQKDKIVQDEALKAGVGYQTYGQLVQAAGKPKVSAREAVGGSKKDAVLEYLKKNGKVGAGGPPPPPSLP